MVVLLAVTIFAIHAGSSGISVWDVIKTIFGAGTKQTNSIVFGIRLPRVVTALIAGMALGMVGCVMQSVLRNHWQTLLLLAYHKGQHLVPQ